MHIEACRAGRQAWEPLHSMVEGPRKRPVRAAACCAHSLAPSHPDSPATWHAPQLPVFPPAARRPSGPALHAPRHAARQAPLHSCAPPLAPSLPPPSLASRFTQVASRAQVQERHGRPLAARQVQRVGPGGRRWWRQQRVLRGRLCEWQRAGKGVPARLRGAWTCACFPIHDECLPACGRMCMRG